jgi:mycothiol system anti-sigma-R factor
VLEEVYLYLDAECDQVSTARIKQHLHECTPCLREYGIEQEVKALVARCCGREVAPDGMRDRLKAKLRDAISVEVTSVEVTSVSASSGDVTFVEASSVEIATLEAERPER